MYKCIGKKKMLALIRRLIAASKTIYSPLRNRHVAYEKYDRRLGGEVAWQYLIIPEYPLVDLN